MSRPSSGVAARARQRVADPSPDDPPAPSQFVEAPVDASIRGKLDHLYRRHATWLKAVLQRRFGRDLAEELSQEAFWRLRRYAVDDLQHPRALLVTIASNVARETHRRRSVRAPDAVFGAGAPDSRTPAWSDQDQTLLLKQIILGLPPKFQEVFVLSRLEGLTYPEIGQRLGIATKTVEWRMTKALDICAARLRN